MSNKVIVSGLNSNASYIATQASAQMRWRIDAQHQLVHEVDHYFPGDFIKQATPVATSNYWTGWLDIRY